MWGDILKKGYWNGEIWNRRKDGASYAGRLSINALRDDAGKITHYVGVTGDITEFKLAQDRVRHLAYYDQLTGLPNGTMMRDRVNQLIASAQHDRREFSLLFIDLDNFKNVNDSLGHHVGDLLLQTIAGRLRTAVREMDTVARMGGDEFVVVLPEVGVEGAQQVARKIIGQVTTSFSVGMQKISMTTSVGIVNFPKDAGDIESILKHAELALYQAKAKGKNDYAFFTADMNVLAFERMRIENDLRQALLNEELVLYYQPQISLKTRKLVGMEALVRWPHPSLQMIPPDQFIPVAEESDLIIELGEWVMHEACRQMRQWQRSGLEIVPVAVNVAAKQMKHADFADSVASVLRKTRLDPKWLELELTERAVMADVDTTISVMKKVGDMGVKFSVDDFGTGYSSLAYLKHLPLDKLKIDKSFVNDLAIDENDREIANTIIQLAHGLKLSVVAEGVETQQQMSILLGQGCDSAQGYLFSRPLQPDEAAAFLHAAQTA
jgi:diguanylate cyclase (GGDEF)-like protein